MDITRNQYWLFGWVLLFLGLQFRLIDSVELKPEVSQMLFKQSAPALAAASDGLGAFSTGASPAIRKTVKPPEWIGWALLSVGAVLLLHAAAMPKSG
ncbi:MAG: hypothetical protein ACOY3P_14725 [Planctomycetota bacterium]